MPDVMKTNNVDIMMRWDEMTGVKVITVVSVYTQIV